MGLCMTVPLSLDLDILVRLVSKTLLDCFQVARAGRKAAQCSGYSLFHATWVVVV